MIRKLVQKQIISHQNSFRQELTKMILSLDLPKYSNNTDNKQFTDAQKLSLVILYFHSKKSLRDFCEEIKETIENFEKVLIIYFRIIKNKIFFFI